MRIRTINIIYTLIVLLTSLCCSRKEDELPHIQINNGKILKNLDSIYLLAQQVYLWNEQLPSIEHFNPQRFFSQETDEITMYKNEIFEITRYTKIVGTGDFYEYNSFVPTLPKYSSIVSRFQTGSSNDTYDKLYNPFGLSIGVTDSVIRLLYVDPNSPSGKARLKRGDRILTINGATVDSEQSFLAQWKRAIAYSFIKLEVVNNSSQRREVRLNATVYEPNPVVKSMVLEQGQKKIGYFVYNSFTPKPNSEKYLTPVFLTFEQNKVTELVVDLRYNQGGYQTTANFLANLIAPVSLNGKVMYSEHYNKQMQEGRADILKNYYILDDNNKPIYINQNPLTLFDIDYSVASNVSYFEKTDGLSAVKKIYFIVSSMTASASELLINVLKPYCDVHIIGVSKDHVAEVCTYGKPIGFFDIPVGEFDLYLSMFEIKNAQNIAGYYNGIKADRAVLDDIRYDFGETDDPAIAFVLSGSNLKKTAANNKKSIEMAQGRSNYYLNGDRLNGIIKCARDLKVK